MEEPQICARPECAKPFYKRVHNMKFCSDECTKIETNRRIMRKYYENKERLSGKVRWCSECESTQLSRYNEGTVCAACEMKAAKAGRESIMDMLKGIMV